MTSTATMKELLTDDHRELDDLLINLYKALDTGTPLDVFEKLDIFWARLAMHIRAEHLQLFPATLKALEAVDSERASEGRAAFARLRIEHDVFMVELASAMKMIRRQIRNEENSREVREEIRNKVNEIEELLIKHNDFEESEVYVWARELLEPDRFEELEIAMKRELDNLPPRFDGDRDGSKPRVYD